MKPQQTLSALSCAIFLLLLTTAPATAAGLFDDLKDVFNKAVDDAVEAVEDAVEAAQGETSPTDQITGPESVAIAQEQQATQPEPASPTTTPEAGADLLEEKQGVQADCNKSADPDCSGEGGGAEPISLYQFPLVALAYKYAPEKFTEDELNYMIRYQVNIDQMHYAYTGGRGSILPGGPGYKPVFEKAQVHNRPVEFAIRELMPQYRKHLASVVAALPDRYRLPIFARQLRYDFEKGHLFNWQNRGNELEPHHMHGLTSGGFIPLGAPVDNDRITQMPELKARAVYRIKSLIGGDRPRGNSSFRNPSDRVIGTTTIFNDNNREPYFRSVGLTYGLLHGSGGSGRMALLALDRKLDVAPIVMDVKAAEALLTKHQNRDRWVVTEIDIDLHDAFRIDAAWVFEGSLVDVKVYAEPHELLRDYRIEQFALVTDLVAEQASAAAVAMEAAEEQKTTEAAAMDIVGINIGMPRAKAERIINDHMNVESSYEFRHLEPKSVHFGVFPFARGRFYIGNGRNESFVLVTEPVADTGDQVFGLTRKLKLGDQVNADRVWAQVESKYGKPAFKQGNHRFWGVSAKKRNCTPGDYSVSGYGSGSDWVPLTGYLLNPGPQLSDQERQQYTAEQAYIELLTKPSVPTNQNWKELSTSSKYKDCGNVLSATYSPLNSTLTVSVTNFQMYFERFAELYVSEPAPASDLKL